MRLLIAEDEKDLNILLTKKMEKAGYAVDSCRNGKEAWELLEATSYDVAILDIMMPEMDGLTLLKKIRNSNIQMPVLFLTARDGVEDRVEGLDSGANDYLVKPFHFEELMARIRVLVRGKDEGKSNVYELGDLKIDIGRHTAERAGVQIELSAKEFSILEYLMINKNSVISRTQIEEHVWGYEYEGASNMVDVYIRYLRKKIDEPFESALIHTIRGVGYVLREEKCESIT